MAINNSWQLAPWADALYACDYAWWNLHHGVPDFPGLKLSQDKQVRARPAWGVKGVGLVKQDRLILEPLGTVGWGGNSGFHALNLAVQFGAKRILLVGYDMQIAGGLHWHGRHPQGLNNPTVPNVARWRRVVDEAAPTLARIGVEVINCSPVSALENYPKMSLADAL